MSDVPQSPRPGTIETDLPVRDLSWKRPQDWPNLLLTEAVMFYRVAISPLKPVNTCRFIPTCSAYALESLQVHGAVRGTVLSTIRILKCAPWHPGGYDPVPEPGALSLRSVQRSLRRRFPRRIKEK